MRFQEHQKIRKTATKKSNNYRSARLRKGDGKGLTEDAAVLPEPI
jgi:hypothetical protein